MNVRRGPEIGIAGAGSEAALEAPVTVTPTGTVTGTPAPARRSEFRYFALRNWKFVLGCGLVLALLALALFGPLVTDHEPLAFDGPTDHPPSSVYWFGTTSYGQDVFTQFVYGLRAAFLVGAVGGGIAWLLGASVGFTAGYRGGWLDDLLNMLTNVVLVIPTLAILIIVAAYLNVHSYATEAILIGLTSWPWAARAVRAQTFSLKTRDFVRHRAAQRTEQPPDHHERDRTEHELVPADDVHPALRRRDPDRRVARLPRARALDVGVARADDEQLVPRKRPPARLLVVVRPAGRRDHPHRRRALRHERRPRRGLQPEAEGADEPQGRRADGLLPVAPRRREGRGRGDVRDRGRRDHGARRRVRLREVDARQEPDPDGHAHALRLRQRRARRQRAPDPGRLGDERLPVQGGLDHPAVRAQRPEPDAPDRHDGDRAALLEARSPRRGLARVQAPSQARRAAATTCSTGIRSSCREG